MDSVLNEIVRRLLKCAHWLVERLPQRIQSRLRPTLDDWTHRYMLHLILLTYSFLVWLELREREQMHRRGRPRGVFSPSA